MRRAVQLFVMLAVLVCGMHAGEPAEAHEDAGYHLLHAEAHMPADHAEEGGHSDKVAHAGHQHCPLAADHGSPPVSPAAPFAGVQPFARDIAALESLSRAPPVEPPAT